MQQQDMLAGNAQSAGANQTAGQTAQATDALASQGGLSSGARERAAEGGANNFMNMSQNINQQRASNDMQIGVNDEQNKIQELGQLPGMENQKVQGLQAVNAADTANQIAENQSLNSYNQNLYNQQMSAWGANQQANAIAASGKK
jgi:hypothetical protein